MKPTFYTGLHHPALAKILPNVMLSINILLKRKSYFEVGNWILDSGAFTRISSGKEHLPIDQYAAEIERWSKCGNLQAAVSQDYMCEQFILEMTGQTVADHQRLTIERYDELIATNPSVYVLPVLQGYTPEEYRTHVRLYGNRLKTDAWVGVGSVCKRNKSPIEVLKVLRAIKEVRPDLQLHGFGIKKTALKAPHVAALLATCDSMAWSFNARINGRNPNGASEALSYAKSVASIPDQLVMI
jgi:hypothetical protein